MSDSIIDELVNFGFFILFAITVVAAGVIYVACLFIYLLFGCIYIIIKSCVSLVSLITAYINELISNISAHISSHPYLFMIIASLLLFGLGFFLASKYDYYISKKDNEVQEQ